MPYPNRYTPNHDFALDDQQGDAVDGTRLAIELANIAEAVNQTREFIRAGFASDRKWRPLSAVSQELVDTFRYVASTGQTAYTFPSSTTVDPAADKVLVYVDGQLVDPDSTTVTASGFTIPAQSAGAIVVAALYNDSQNLRDDLASVALTKGASLVGIADQLGRFSSVTVEGALEELRLALDQISSAVGDLTGLIRSDGSVLFQANQDMGGNRIVNAADGIDDTDYVTVQQLDALAAIYGSLSSIYLALSGGTMSGIIDMGNNKITNLSDGSATGDAVNKGQLDAVSASFVATYLPLAGGTMTGEINSKQNSQAIRIRQAVDDDEPVRKDQVDSLVAAGIEGASFGGIGGSGVLGSFPADPSCPCATTTPDFGSGAYASGVYDYRTLTLSAAPSLGGCVVLRCTGDLTAEGLTLALAQANDYSGLAPNLASTQPLTVTVANTLWASHRKRLPSLTAGTAGGAYPFSPAIAGAGGVGGRGGTGDIGNPQDNTPGGQGIIEKWMADRGKTEFTHEYAPWLTNRFLIGGRTSDAALGGGCLLLHVDGDINIEGTEISANGAGGSSGGTYDERIGGGGGSIIIVCGGRIYCGTGATLKANAGAPAGAGQLGGSGGGYVAVVAGGGIEGTLNIEAKGSASSGNGVAGNGGYVEILRGAVESGDADPVSDVSQGTGNTDSRTKDGLAIVGSLQAARIPIAGGLI